MNWKRWSRRVLVVSYALSGAACMGHGACSDGAQDPCEVDAFSCRSASGIDIDPNCSLDTDISVALGEGEHGFSDLDDGDLPRLHHGAQGGEHIFVALMISGGDPAYASFLADVALYEEGARQVGAAGSGEEPEDSGRRSVLIEDANLSADGSFAQAGIVLQVFGPLYGSELILEVTDSCGRTASDSVTLGRLPLDGGEAGARAVP